MLLDSALASEDEDRLTHGQSYVEIGFGDNRKTFAGLHRFEVSRADDGEDDYLTIWYSSISCNPSVNETVLPHWVWKFHKWYAMVLFRDGIREVLKSD